MFIANYAISRNRCKICKGVGCSYCGNTGIREHKHLILSNEQLTQQHIQMQQHVKEVKGQIIND